MSQESGSVAARPRGDSAFWSRATRRTQALINVGWWVDALLPFGFAAALIVAAIILASRRESWASTTVAIASGLVVAAAGVVSYIRARSRFVSARQARAQLDYGLLLHNQLSAAQAGVVPWPERTRWRSGLWRWNWRRLALVPGASAFLVLSALWVPLPAQRKALPPPTAKPPDLAQVEDWLKTLSETPQIDQTSLEQTREQAEQIARQDPSEWYSHASLEAADHLKASLKSGLRNMADSAAKLESLVGAAQRGAEGNDWQQRLQSALSALEGNVPGLSKSLASQLREIDPSKLRSLSPEQLQQLKQQLKEGAGACEKCMGNGAGEKAGKGKGKGDKEGEGEGEGDGDEDDDTGAGVSRGPGTRPLTFKKQPVNLGTQKTEAVQNSDLSQAAVGDQIGMSAGQHDVDPSANHRAASGGAANADGDGGSAVWLQQNIAPEERRRLQQFFK